MKDSFQKLYSKMMDAKNSGLEKLADDFRIEIERLRKQNSKLPSLSQLDRVSIGLPPFALRVLGKNQKDLNLSARSNCINAAFNFHDLLPHHETYSTLELLVRLQLDFIQLADTKELEFGDLVVMWSRNGDSWKNRLIDVSDMHINDSEFPYGLVFDHVVVYLGEGLVFHKPDPTLESRYQIDFIESVMMTTKNNQGFELTWHRKR